MILRGEDNPIVYWEKKVYKFTEFRKNDRNFIILSNLTSRIYIRVIGLILTKLYVSIRDGKAMEDSVMLRAMELAREAGRERPNQDDFDQAKDERDKGVIE
jgi:hypothetical protein